MCEPPALLSLFSPGRDISTGRGLRVSSHCELTPGCLAWVSPWGHNAVSAPALGKVSVRHALLQHVGKQLWLLQLLLSRFAPPAPGQGCPMGRSLLGSSHRQWPHGKKLRSVLVHPACSRHSSQVLCE